MNYVVFGKIIPERADVSFARQIWQSAEGDALTISCDSSQITVVADLKTADGYVTAFLMAEQIAEAVVSALGFALGTGYRVELVQIVSAAGDAQTMGVRPGELEFEQHGEVFSKACELCKKDVSFRLAIRDYTTAIGEALDCAHYCYRAIESIRAAFAEGQKDGGWSVMHGKLGTSREEITLHVKGFADPVRHGNWLASRGTSSAQRHKMLQVTRDVLDRYLRVVGA